MCCQVLGLVHRCSLLSVVGVDQIKNWRRRWFVLRGFQLKYYKAEQGADSNKKVQGLIDVRDFNVQRATIAKSKLALRLVSRQSANQVRLTTHRSGCGNVTHAVGCHCGRITCCMRKV